MSVGHVDRSGTNSASWRHFATPPGGSLPATGRRLRAPIEGPESVTVDPDTSVLNPLAEQGILGKLDEQLGVIGHHDVYDIIYGEGANVRLRAKASGHSPLGARKGDGIGLDEGWTVLLYPKPGPMRADSTELPQATTRPKHPGAGSPLINSITRPEGFGFRIRGMLAKLDSIIAWRRGQPGSEGLGEPREFTSLHRPQHPPRRALGT
jgi:hypothetical protein